MNFKALASLTATGSDQSVTVPRGSTLLIRPIGATVQVRDVTGAANYITYPANVITPLGRSQGQTLYLLATAGTVIELATI